MKLNLGCSDDLKAGYINVDSWTPPGATAANFLQVDLSGQEFYFIAPGRRVALYDPSPWPFDDSTVEEILAYDVFEHVENQAYRGNKGIIWCLNESHRILRPGGVLRLRVPCLDHNAPGGGVAAVFCDPTHVQAWTQDTRYYFDERWNNPQGERGRLGPAYGITARFKTRPNRGYLASGEDWTPIQYAKDAPERRKLILELEAVK